MAYPPHFERYTKLRTLGQRVRVWTLEDKTENSDQLIVLRMIGLGEG